MVELFDQSMNMMLSSQYERIEAVQKAMCIAVIDEASSPSEATLETNWISFRSQWPQRPFYLLSPTSTDPQTGLGIKTPPSFDTEVATPGSITYGPIEVERETGSGGVVVATPPDNVADGISDWFHLCGVAAHYNSPSFFGDRTVFLFVDDSGSMTVSAVGQSVINFINNCNNASGGRIQIKAVVNGAENYILPFIAFEGATVNDICDMPFTSPTTRNWLNANYSCGV